MTMWAARIEEWGSAPRISEVPIPRPQPGEVLVKMQSAGLSHLDLTIASGAFGIRPTLPYIGGIEGSGLICEAADIPVGSQVLLRGGGLGSRRDGTWAEYITAPRKAVTVLTRPLPPEVAATFFQPTSTAYVALHDVGQVTSADRVAVIGAAGAVGSQVIQQASQIGAATIGLVGREDQVADVPEGVERVMVLGGEAAASLTEERSVTVLIDTLGGAEFADRLAWVAPGGRAVVIGYVAGTSTSLDLPNWLLSDVTLLPVNMIRAEPRAREVAAKLVERLHRGELTLSVEQFALENIATGLAALREGRVRGRAAISFPEIDQ